MPPGSARPSRSSRDVHAIAEQVTSPDHHIADVDADAELKAAILRHPGVRLCELLLNGYSALNRIDRARELCEHAIASGVGNPSPVVLNQSIHDLAGRRQGAQRRRLVLAYQARVPGYVGCKNCGQPPLDPLFVWWLHRSSPALGNVAPGAVGVQAGCFRQGADVPNGSARACNLAPHPLVGSSTLTALSPRRPRPWPCVTPTR